MARKPRKLVHSEVYHIILRGNDRQNIFYDDSDRIFFINRIKKYSQETELEVYAYCLMDNHVHLLIGKANRNMALFVKKLACSYVYRFNHKYERTGHLFQGRYKSEPVETSEYFKTVYRYILKNPEKSGLCGFREYKWNSYPEEKSSGYIIDVSFLDFEFGSYMERMKFLDEDEEDSCMEDISVIQPGSYDDELKTEFIRELFDIQNVLSIRRDSEEIRKDRLRLLKKIGLPVSQIARITGISRYYIKRA